MLCRKGFGTERRPTKKACRQFTLLVVKETHPAICYARINPGSVLAGIQQLQAWTVSNKLRPQSSSEGRFWPNKTLGQSAENVIRKALQPRPTSEKDPNCQPRAVSSKNSRPHRLLRATRCMLHAVFPGCGGPGTQTSLLQTLLHHRTAPG